MPKYRRLSTSELTELEKEFVDFLVVNGIVASDWEKLKANEPVKASTMIDLFSDVVFESILRQSTFLEWRSKNEIRTFQCLEKDIVLVGLKADESGQTDFTNEEFIKKAAKNPPTGVKIYTKTKAYKKSREEDMYKLMKGGAEISDGILFKALATSI